MSRPSNPFAIATISPPQDWRRIKGVDYVNRRFGCQSIGLTLSWGTQPGRAQMTYIGSAPVNCGSHMTIECGGHTFYGICENDLPLVGSRGNTRSLTFEDYRCELTEWDNCFGAFNQRETIQIGGQRIRRYFSILPNDFLSGRKTYKNGTGYAPFTAAEIIGYVLGCSRAPWRVWHCDPTTGVQTEGYHASLLNFASLDIDAMSGRKLGAVIEEVCNQHGIVFTIMGPGAFDLTFARKGEPISGTLAIPELSDDRRNGTALSRAPTRVAVVGGRNLYQVHNVDMIPDWAPGFQAFYDPVVFQNYVFDNFTTQAGIRSIPAGTRFDSIVGDTENVIGRQLANARALEMTVAEFVTHRQAVHSDGDEFTDWRKFTGRPRMQMPVVLYLRTILFRAFRVSSGYRIRNLKGQLVPINSMTIEPRMIAPVTHDPVTGAMSWDTSLTADGPGYAIVQGYQVGEDGFRTIRPDRFNLEDWTDAQKVWQHIPFQIDDSGADDQRYILFDEPVIRSENLFTTGSTADERAEFNGYVGLNSNPTFKIPPVRAALTFAAERFFEEFGYGVRTDTVSIANLNEEAIGTVVSLIGTWTRNLYSDGKTGYQRAQEVANSLLARQFTYPYGGYRKILKRNAQGGFDPGTKLSGLIDRVTIESSPQGLVEQVDFTAERTWPGFAPDREFDRNTREKAMFPGQQQLREEANQSRLIAAGLRSSPKATKSIVEAFHGNSATAFPVVGSSPVAVGSPVWKEPTENSESGNSKTTGFTTSGPLSRKIFVGATLVHGASTGTMWLSNQGLQLLRVKGPVTVGGGVGKAVDEDANHLVADGSPGVGVANQSIEATAVRLIEVRVGAVPVKTGGIVRLAFVKQHDDFLECRAPEGHTIYVAKPTGLRASHWNPGWSAGTNNFGISIGAGGGLYKWAFRYASSSQRFKIIFDTLHGNIAIPNALDGLERNDEILDLPAMNVKFVTVREEIDPPYEVAATAGPGATTVHVASIYAIKTDAEIMKTPSGLDGVPAGLSIRYLDLNLDSRRWIDSRQARAQMFVVDLVGADSSRQITYATKSQSAIQNPADDAANAVFSNY
jgi:hypothetical protein